jgi:hypothetical protein
MDANFNSSGTERSNVGGTPDGGFVVDSGVGEEHAPAAVKVSKQANKTSGERIGTGTVRTHRVVAFANCVDATSGS